MDCTPPGSSVPEFSRQQYWSGLPCPPPRDRPNPGTKPTSLMSAALADRFFTTKFTRGSPIYMMYRIWHNFKRWKRDDTLWVFLLVSCTFTHSSWVSLSLPNICSFFLKATTSVLCGFLASMEPKGQGERLANETELTFNITQRLSWKTSDSSAYFICGLLFLSLAIQYLFCPV